MSVLQHFKVIFVIHAREDGLVKRVIVVTRVIPVQNAMYVRKVGYQRPMYWVPCVDAVNREDGEVIVSPVKIVPKTIKMLYVEIMIGMIQIFISWSYVHLLDHSVRTNTTVIHSTVKVSASSAMKPLGKFANSKVIVFPANVNSNNVV